MILKILSFVLSFVLSISSTIFIHPKQTEVQYARYAVVLEASENETVFEDTTENMWGITGSSGFSEGQMVMLLMSDNTTPSIFDDEILGVYPVATADYHDFTNLHFNGCNDEKNH